MMQTQFNYDHYSVGQLRGMLRHIDSQQMPERYERIQGEIERREAGGQIEAKPVLPEEDGRSHGGFFAAVLFALGVYGFILFALASFAQMAMTASLKDLLLVTYGLFGLPSAFLLSLASLGVITMCYLLRKLDDEVTVKTWAFVAAGLAPFTSFPLVGVFVEAFIMIPDDGPPSTMPFDVCCYLASFYLPFVLITLGLSFGSDTKSQPVK